MRIVYLGSGEFSVPSLLAVATGSHELVRVITQPARPAGRGGKLKSTPVAEHAKAKDIPFVECGNINEPQSLEMLRADKPDVICIVDFGQVLSWDVIKAPKIDTFNLHASLLPELRGAAPINWAIIRGLKQTGVTTFSVVKEMDAGDIYLQEATEINPLETAGELKHRLAEIGAGLVCQTLDLIASGSARPQPQNHAKITLAPKLKKSHGLIDWSNDATTIRNLIHGTWPWPGGQAVFRRRDGREYEVIIARADVVENPASSPPGTIENDLTVATGDGRVKIFEIKPSGTRLMQWKDFVNGYRATGGDCFVKPVLRPNT